MSPLPASPRYSFSPQVGDVCWEPSMDSALRLLRLSGKMPVGLEMLVPATPAPLMDEHASFARCVPGTACEDRNRQIWAEVLSRDVLKIGSMNPNAQVIPFYGPKGLTHPSGNKLRILHLRPLTSLGCAFCFRPYHRMFCLDVCFLHQCVRVFVVEGWSPL